MCGIVGIVGSGASRELAEAMVRSVAHRGPDGSGLWTSPSGRAVLAHRRLAIIDLSEAGRQPMSTSDGRFTRNFFTPL